MRYGVELWVPEDIDMPDASHPQDTSPRCVNVAYSRQYEPNLI